MSDLREGLEKLVLGFLGCESKYHAHSCPDGNPCRLCKQQASEIVSVLLAAMRIKVDVDGPYKGWVSVRHADGQWVTAAKLDPFSMSILAQPLATLTVKAKAEAGGFGVTE